jgi:hypothetical protein
MTTVRKFELLRVSKRGRITVTKKLSVIAMVLAISLVVLILTVGATASAAWGS